MQTKQGKNKHTGRSVIYIHLMTTVAAITSNINLLQLFGEITIIKF